MNKKISVARRPALVKKPLLIEGISRTGKFLLGNILDGLKNVDHYQYVSLLEHIPFLEKLKIIPEDVAVSLLQVALDEHAYDMQVGRNLNFRQSDKSSLYGSLREKEYVKRMEARDDSKAVKNFRNGCHFSPFVVHEGMPNIKIFFKAYPSVKIISIVRHPVDIVHSWYSRGYGTKEIADPLSFQPCLAVGGNPIPWYVYKDSKFYTKANRMDRVVRSIINLFDMSAKTARNLTAQQKKQILFITYEELVENSHQVIKQMGEFLNTKPLPIMLKILKKEHCPNKKISKDRDKKYQQIKEKASKTVFRSLTDLIAKYEAHEAKIFLGHMAQTK